MSTTLLIGGQSTIGVSYQRHAARNNHSVTATTRRPEIQGMPQLDLAAEPSTWPELPHADVTFFCAAMARLNACEAAPEAAERINATNSFKLAKRLHDAGSFIVYFSTNHVFDGSRPYRESSEPTCPINAYGRSKARGEEKILTLPNAAVFRLSKSIEPPFELLEGWRAKLNAGKPVQPFHDMYVAPVPRRLILAAMDIIAASRRPGIYQISGPRDVSYAALAGQLAHNIGAPASLVAPVSAASAGQPPMFTPRHTTFVKTGLDALDPPDAFAPEFFT